MKVPAKILIPLIVCIFPVLFIVILVPAVLNAVAQTCVVLRPCSCRICSTDKVSAGRGYGAVGSTSRSHREGQGFESP